MAAQQWVGPGEDGITLEGTLMPELTGGPESLDKLRDMAASGKAWILTAGTGENMGRWIIAQEEESRSAMLGNGFPRKIGFSLSLKAYDDDDPASRPKKLKTGAGHRPWGEAEIAAFRAHWPLGSVERTAFELALNTGQRGEDVVLMERLHFGKDGIAVAQEKTAARVWIPVSTNLQDALRAWERTLERRSASYEDRRKPVPLAIKRMLLSTETGRAFTVDNFRHKMIAAYQAVPGLKSGLECGGVTSHGLRYTAATVLHELDCDWDTIAAITGHETVQMVRKYTAKKRRAKLAIARLDAARNEAKKNPS